MSLFSNKKQIKGILNILNIKLELRKTDQYSKTRTKMIACAFLAECILLIILYSVKTGGLSAQVLSDVIKNSYEGQAALYLEKENVISGYPDGTFKGDKTVNRAEAAKILLLAGNFTLSNLRNNGIFPDVQTNSWYESFVMNAVKAGLMEGYPNGLFEPEKNINRAEFLKMLSKAFGVQAGIPYHYEDAPEDDWYSIYAGAAEQYNLFLYDKSYLHPALNMTRNEVAWAVYQMLINKSLSMTVKTPYDYIATTGIKIPNMNDQDGNMHTAAQSSSVKSSASSNYSSASSNYNTVFMCSDSDQTKEYPLGFNEWKKGTTVNHNMPQGMNKFTDTCVGFNQLYEYHCNANGYPQRTLVNCIVACEDGACVLEKSSSSVSSKSSISLSTSSSVSSSVSSSSLSSEAERECSDSDVTGTYMDGNNPLLQGTVNGYVLDGRKLSFTDVCANAAFLQEFTCGWSALVSSEYIACPNGCLNGACIPNQSSALPQSSVSPQSSALPQSSSQSSHSVQSSSQVSQVSSSSSASSRFPCTDTDKSSIYINGKNPYKRGKAVGYSVGGNQITEWDTCINYVDLKEFYCGTNEIIMSENIYCLQGCINGACEPEPPDPTCEDTDSHLEDQYTNFGEVYYVDYYGGQNNYYDYCVGDYILIEYGCMFDESNITEEYYYCEYGCEYGACRDITANLCGNGFIERTNNETCDDGNNFSFDGCSSSCIVENGWMCMGEPSICSFVYY